MKVAYSSNFNKKIKKIPKKVVDRFYERLELFKVDIFHPILNNHALTGEHKDKRSFNVTGDYRVWFYYIGKDAVILTDIGTHSELYR